MSAFIIDKGWLNRKVDTTRKIVPQAAKHPRHGLISEYPAAYTTKSVYTATSFCTPIDNYPLKASTVPDG